MGEASKDINPQQGPDGRFLPGNNASPGRKPISKGGKPNAATIVRQAIENHVFEIIETLAAEAKKGDTAAAKLLLERVSPSLRSIEHLGLDGATLPRMEVRSKGADSQVIEGDAIDITPDATPSHDDSDVSD